MWSEVASFIAGGVTAVFSEPARQWIFKPKLSLEPYRGWKPDLVNASGIARAFFHLRVRNTGRRVAKNCDVRLVALQSEMPDHTFSESTLSIPLPFCWAPSEMHHATRDLVTEEILDFVYINQSADAVWPSLQWSYVDGHPGKVAPPRCVRYWLRINALNTKSTQEYVFEIRYVAKKPLDLHHLRENLTLRVVPLAVARENAPLPE